MKKVFVMAVAAMMATMTVNAQTGYEDTRHEIAISYGAGSNSQIIDGLEEALVAPIGATFGDDKYLGPISVEYFYHAKSWIGIGCIFVYGQNKQDMKMDGQDAGKLVNSYISVMPAVKFDWLRREHFGMYSKVGVGLTMRSEKIEDNSSIKDDSETQTHLNWQVSLIGIEAGGPRLRGFVELGTGEQGILLAGVRCKF